MTPTKHPLSWFIERIGKTVIADFPDKSKRNYIVDTIDYAEFLHDLQKPWRVFRDPHPLTSSILTCSVISCDRCGKVGTTEDLDKEVAAKGFDEYGWKLLMDGTINCGCK